MKVLLTGPQLRQSVWQWVCLYVHVCMLSKQSLNSSASPPLVHPLTSPPRPHPPISPPDRMTAHCALSKLNQCPAHWGSHQSSCRTPGPLGLMAHPRHPFIHAPLSPSSPTPGSSPPPFASLNYSSVYVSCQARVKKMQQPSWNTGRVKEMGWISADTESITFTDMLKNIHQI